MAGATGADNSAIFIGIVACEARYSQANVSDPKSQSGIRPQAAANYFDYTVLRSIWVRGQPAGQANIVRKSRTKATIVPVGLQFHGSGKAHCRILAKLRKHRLRHQFVRRHDRHRFERFAGSDGRFAAA